MIFAIVISILALLVFFSIFASDFEWGPRDRMDADIQYGFMCPECYEELEGEGFPQKCPACKSKETVK